MGCAPPHAVYSPQTAKDSSVEKLLLKLNGWYLEKEGKMFDTITSPPNIMVVRIKLTGTFWDPAHLLLPPRTGVQVVMRVDGARHQPLQPRCAEGQRRGRSAAGLPGDASGARSRRGEGRGPRRGAVGRGVAGQRPG